MLSSILAPSLRRSLFARMLLVSLLPMALLGILCSQFAERMLFARFEVESLARAHAVATRLEDRVQDLSKNARLVAELPIGRDALIAGDAATVRRLLLPIKTRLDLDMLNVGNADGTILGAAQDLGSHTMVRPELRAPFLRRAEQSWMLDQHEPDGLLLLAGAPIRGDGRLLGMVEVGTYLDTDFLRPLAEGGLAQAGASDARIGLFWDRRAQATTWESLGNVDVPSVDELQATPNRVVVRHVTLDGAPYYGVFSIVESHQTTPAVLAVLLPLAQMETARQLLTVVVGVMLAVLAVVVALIAYWSAGTFSVPLLRLAKAAHLLEQGERAMEVAAKPSAHELGQLERAFSNMADTLQAREQTLAALVSQLEIRALSDELTGLPNRAALHGRLEEALASADAANPLALLLVDLDRFKEVNDTLGHQAGDAVLVQVARRFRQALSTSDVVARLGGDEFAIVLPGTNQAGAVRVAEKLLAELEPPVLFLDRPLDVGASFGIAARLGDNDDPAALLRRADVAMYAAKRGRTGYAVYSADQDDHTPDRLALLGELRHAINANQLVLFFQPKVSLSTGRIVHAEALVRWQHPEHGLLGPDRFIPLAEQTGLIGPLTEWVLAASLQQARTWRERGAFIPIAVNVSTQNLQDPLLAEGMPALLERYGVTPESLIIEITETSVLANPARATEVLGRLRALGVRVAIDDFGAGQSALGYLKQLPADELKIDRSLIRDLPHSVRDEAIVRAAIDLGHSLGLTVVAEGVEDAATWDQLAVLGCDVAQGFYMARPLNAPDLDTWLAKSPWGVNAAHTQLPRAA